MMIEPFSVPMVDCTGKIRRIRSLSLDNRRWFLDVRQALQDRSDGQDFRLLYDSDPAFKALVDECLQLSGISPAWVDAYMASRLLFGLGDEPAILMQLNFPPEPEERSQDTRPLPEGIDPEAFQVASLWGATENLEQALKLRSEHPWREVKEVLKARSHQMQETDLEAKAKAKEEERLEQSRAAMDKLKDSGKLGELLNAANRNGSPGAATVELLPDDFRP